MRHRLGQNDLARRRLCVILDTQASDAGHSLSLARQVIDAGCMWIQVREKAMSDRDRLNLLRRIAELVEGTDVWVFANDRPDMAILSGASGVHLGPTDIQPDDARRLFEIAGMSRALIGASARTPERALRAEALGADYIGCGCVFGAGTKSDAVEIGLDGLSAVTASVDIPVIAIGGISAERVREVASSGASGVAACAAIVSAKDPAAAVSEFMEELNSAFGA